MFLPHIQIECMNPDGEELVKSACNGAHKTCKLNLLPQAEFLKRFKPRCSGLSADAVPHMTIKYNCRWISKWILIFCIGNQSQNMSFIN